MLKILTTCDLIEYGIHSIAFILILQVKQKVKISLVSRMIKIGFRTAINFCERNRLHNIYSFQLRYILISLTIDVFLYYGCFYSEASMFEISRKR